MPGTMTNTPLHPWEGNARTVATVLVATDGTEQSDGALRVALARSGEMGAHLAVLTIATTEPIVSPEASFALWSEANVLRRNALRDAVEAQLTRVTGRERTHSVRVLEGNPAYVIARVAIEQRAAVIVVGLGRHEVVDRLFSDETALQLARISRVPVLAVPSTARVASRHAVVAVDFSELSTRAAQAAIEAVGDDGRVDLVHIMPRLCEDSFSIASRGPYERWAQGQLAALTQQLVVPEGVEVNRVALRGRPAPELLAYADRVGADLMATGTHGRGFVARTLIGSVTSQLLRAATCALLTVPRHPLPALTSSQLDALGMSGGAGQRDWHAMLADFTARNLGRRTILEVDDLEIGAQAQEYNYPLIGAAYDAHDQRLELMLGDRTASGRQFSQRIGGVVGIDVLTNGRGHDVALRIEHGSSQTFLTFAP
jgi:nucleotide-binding universal stress UspA family protein